MSDKHIIHNKKDSNGQIKAMYAVQFLFDQVTKKHSSKDIISISIHNGYSDYSGEVNNMAFDSLKLAQEAILALLEAINFEINTSQGEAYAK